jgi:hypothetical protein
MLINVERIDLGAGTSGYAYNVVMQEAEPGRSENAASAFPSPDERKAKEEKIFQELQRKAKSSSQAEAP